MTFSKWRSVRHTVIGQPLLTRTYMTKNKIHILVLADFGPFPAKVGDGTAANGTGSNNAAQINEN